MLACSRIHVVGGADPPGQVRVVLPERLRRVLGFDVPRGPPARQRVLEIVPGDGGDGVGFEADPGHARFRRFDLREHDRNGAVGPAGRVLAVDAAHDARRVAAVVGAAVDGQRHVDGVAGLEDDPVGPLRVDRGIEVEGVGVVAAPFLVGAHDLNEAGPGGVGPDVHVGRHLQNGEEPLVGFEEAVEVIVGGELLDQPLVGRRPPRPATR